jgi:hypothetical protein
MDVVSDLVQAGLAYQQAYKSLDDHVLLTDLMEVLTPGGRNCKMKIPIRIIRTDNILHGAAARNKVFKLGGRNYVGCRLCIIQGITRGNVQIMTDTEYRLDLSYVVATLRWLESKLRGRIPQDQGFDYEYWSKPGDHPMCPEWYYLAEKNSGRPGKNSQMALNGTKRSNSGVSATRIYLETIHRITASNLRFLPEAAETDVKYA